MRGEQSETVAASWIQWGIRVAIAVAIALTLSVIPYRAIGGNTKLAQMDAELAKVTADIADLKKDVRRRKRFVRALKSDVTTIETIARDELQMLYPHEKTLRLQRLGKGQ